jgi:phosphatidylglycerophosphate synthase
MRTASGLERPGAADFLARNRGGGLFTETVNQRLGSYLCVPAHRLGLAPTVLTITNLVLGLAGSIMVGTLAPAMRGGDVPAAAVGLGALLLWQLAYSLDCADGQLARVTGATSPAGARVDVLSDVALQISLVTAVSAVAAGYSPETTAWLVAAFASTWMVNLVTSALQQSGAEASLVTSDSPLIRAVKLVRDYGAVVTAIGLVLAFAPQWTVWLMAVFVVVNGGFLIASIVAAVRASLSQS